LPEDDEEYLLKNTVVEERQKIRQIVRRLGPRLSGLIMTSGLLTFIFGLCLLIMPQGTGLSPGLNIILMAALAFVGVLNILGGLLVLLGEE